MDKVEKVYRAEVKEVNDATGEIDLMIPISSGQVDRDGEIIEPSAFKKTIPKFMKHPVLVASHDYRDLTHQIGEWLKLKVGDDGVEGRPKYYVNEGNPEADWAFKLAQKGVAAFSVGFIPKVWEDGDGEKSPRRTYKEVELLEISQVIIPSNRQAIQSMRSKSVDNPIITELCDEVEKGLEPEGEPEIIQDKEIVLKPEETDAYIRIPVDRGDHSRHRIRTIDISEKEGIKAIYCGTDKVVMTYLFLKSKGWDMAKARAWVKEHGKFILISTTTNSLNDEEVVTASIQTDDIVIHSPRVGKTSQSEIIDEIDYLESLIEKEGLSDKTKDSIKELLNICFKDVENPYLTSKQKQSIGGKLIKMDMGGMKEMHDMMAACETMANKSKKMAEDMMTEAEDHEDMDDEDKRFPGTDMPVNTKNNIENPNIDDIWEEIRKIKLGG